MVIRVEAMILVDGYPGGGDGNPGSDGLVNVAGWAMASGGGGDAGPGLTSTKERWYYSILPEMLVLVRVDQEQFLSGYA